MKKQGLWRVIFGFTLALPIFITACTPEFDEIGEQEIPTPAASPTPLPTPIRVFQTTITADGQVVLPLTPQVFSLQAAGFSGTVEEVYVIPGQAVKAGDPIARIDDTDLRNTLARTEASLISLQAQIANETAPPLAGDIVDAEATLRVRQLELENLESLPSEEAITQAAADLRLREIELRRAQEAYDAVAFAQGIGLSPQAAELEQATINYERAQAAFDESSKPATVAQIAAAELSVIQAQNRLDQLQAGPRSETEAFNAARIQELELQIAEAKANLAKAFLVAPWDGEITAVNAASGVSSGNASVTIAQTEPLRFATSNFSERNLGDIKIGDKATLFLKTYPGIPFPAVVQRIELESTAKDGDTALFTIYFDFNSADFVTRPGMTGRIEISIEPEAISE